MPAKGVAKRDPLLPWDGVASSYPTDATMEPLSIRWTPGRPIGWPGSEFRTPVDLLRVVHILDNFPRALSCYKMPRRRSCPVPYAHRCTVFSYSSIGRDSGISGFRTGATGSVYCRQFRQYGQLPGLWAASRALCGPWLGLWWGLLFGGIFPL